MIKNLKAQKPTDRDGTTQEGREQPTLAPEYVAIEDRSEEALIASAQRLASSLKFAGEGYDNWEAFLLAETTEYRKKSPQEQLSQRRLWAKELAAFLEDPTHLEHDPYRKDLLERPHIALFLTFIRLLDQLKSPMNGLVKRKLDFYFRERLKLEPKQAVPDVVHVLAELAAGVDSLALDQGTQFQAGKDDAGNDLIYATDHQTVMSKAQIAELKTVFLAKETITLKQLARGYFDQPQETIEKMLELAVGYPEPGDPLPGFPEGITDLLTLEQQLKKGDLPSVNYVSEQLSMTSNDFLFLAELLHHDPSRLQQRDDPDLWKAIGRLLENAHHAKVKQQTRRNLAAIHQQGGENGLDDLLEYVYGRPELEGEMPEYQGRAASLIHVYHDLTNFSQLSPHQAAINRGEALEYIRYDLALSEKHFVQLVEAYKQPRALAPGDWEQIYTLLEGAKRSIGQERIQPPKAEKWLGVYAEEDTKATAFSRFGGDQELLQFRAFGGGDPRLETGLKPATLGWAIQSPLLLLSEGKRTITVTISLGCDPARWKTLQDLWAEQASDFTPFQIALTTEEGWVQPATAKVALGSFLLGAPEMEYPALSSEAPFPTSQLASSDEGKFLVGKGGSLYKIERPRNGTVAGQQASPALVLLGVLGDPNAHDSAWKKYASHQVCTHGLRVQVQLDETDLPVTSFVSESPQNAFTDAFPALSLTINAALPAGQRDHDESYYQHMAGITMEKVHLKVAAEGLQEFLIQNDDANLDTKKPFFPFGDAPELGDSLYLAHPELTQKRLDTLHLHWDWMNVPVDFRAHYENYWRVASGKMDPEEEAYGIKDNDAFALAVSLREGRMNSVLSEVSLFPADGKTTIDAAQKKNAKSERPAYHKMSGGKLKSDILDWDRYFKLELTGNDFQHQQYPEILNRQASPALLGGVVPFNYENLEELTSPPVNELATLPINPPYTPKLKGLSLGYSAHTEVVFGEGKADYDEVFHLHPFGYQPLDERQGTSFLPNYQEEGALFIGLENLARPQILSLLFQMAEGSGDADSEPPELQWSHLEGNSWIPFEKAAMLSDTTNGLLNTGIVQLELPEKTAGAHTILPSDKEWLKISCAEHRIALPNVIDIHTQAISATLTTTQASASHFADLLAPESISGTVEPISEIKGLSQPYPSRRGRAEEADQWFYTRVSERLRHKNRALTLWDYEHLVLERFPEVRKVKCLQGDISGDPNQLGCVTIIVIADIRSKMPTNPFEPKLSIGTINQIRRYVEQWSPAYTTIKVVNPVFLQVKAQVTAKFGEGYDPGHYMKELEQDVKRFLAPWAYEGNNNITLGGKMYASGLINYLMKKPYVEFLGRVTLFQREEGEKFVEGRIASGTKGLILTSRPDMAIVSAQSHEIALVSEEDYGDEDPTGFNHMMIEQDLIIHKDLVTQPSTGKTTIKDAPGIGGQSIGSDLQVGGRSSI